ncbi:hypothetical protein [Pontimicrobium aquaticum]|uniref:Uncharacterized protein n=1 Tax=Pontimicrobium aquaticum TaxID=2565367 RepID=A0A4U0EVX4_9FLAO|nr:hypothetical protein [Pontimicrobium aquaticum]TJY36023.1 hypothetical protein E5167_09180 [Pontimicrobium aquaticum]
MIKENLNSILIGIISSILASILIYFIVPLLRKLGKKIVLKISERNKKFREKIISRMARKQSTHLKDIYLLTLMNVIIVVAIIMIIGENLDFSTNYFSETTEIVFLFSIMFILYVGFLFRMFTTELIVDRIRKFEFEITMLDVHLNKKEIKLFKSEWVKMKTENDYSKLNNKIYKLLAKYEC